MQKAARAPAKARAPRAEPAGARPRSAPKAAADGGGQLSPVLDLASPLLLPASPERPRGVGRSSPPGGAAAADAPDAETLRSMCATSRWVVAPSAYLLEPVDPLFFSPAKLQCSISNVQFSVSVMQ